MFVIDMWGRREDIGALGSIASTVGSLLPMGLFLAAVFPNIISVVG